MKILNRCILVAVFAIALLFTGCANWAQKHDFADKTYVYENEGAGGSFAVTINNDGSYTYYEGLYSSYRGMGSWTLHGDILCLSEDKKTGTSFVNYFKVDGDNLVFISENSSNFMLVDVADGDKFTYKERLTLKKVIELSEKGEELTWRDFEQFRYEDIGSGLYIYHYDIDENIIC